MKTTANYALQIPEATDTVNLLTQNYPNFETIDTAMKANKDAAITTATEVKTGTNHAIIRSNTDSSMFRFVATSNMVAGDTFTVDSVVCTATTPNGQSLGAGAFVINQNVLCCLTGTLLTIYAGGSSASEVELAKNAEKLGGELPEYYGTADAVTANTQAIDGLTNDVSELNEKVAKLGNYEYSTAEQDTGMKWIDGQTIYSRTFVKQSSTAMTGSQKIGLTFEDSSTTTPHIIKAELVTREAGGGQIFRFNSTNSDGATLGEQGNTVSLVTVTSAGLLYYCVTVFYVKSANWIIPS